MKILLVNFFLLCAVSSFAKDFGKDSVDNEKCKLIIATPNIYAIFCYCEILTKMQRNKNKQNLGSKQYFKFVGSIGPLGIFID